MKNIFIILYTLLITSCFNFEPLESTIFFKNNCAYKIEVYGGNNIHPNKFILKEGKASDFLVLASFPKIMTNFLL
ncbi:hypothetical protein NJ8700_08925 [Aggregatibacter aphrophilus NJ8700]|uniref:hypothetical protein n=1 Tax=Aggregatibacter aphrophilus TaxID=732 RepID=UPI00022FEFBE|nr:hypothetical protein [Aggregatibacter aphrophilus]AKS65512.1 hypothetical protein NJ8700_08925 [Aggregatibacter aphrophilus NJ8700]EHB89746.1 hypothetical protein HMPREF9335_01440 [Aggregatibacter aphrophilus F0387]